MDAQRKTKREPACFCFPVVKPWAHMLGISCSFHAGYTTVKSSVKKTFLNSSEHQRFRGEETKMEDEAEIYDGIRAQFPLTFGKLGSKNSDSKTNETLPTISSSSKAWLDSLRNSKSPNPNPNGSVIGRPPAPVPDGDGDDDVMVGPPPPPGLGEDDDIGPPRPLVQSSLESDGEEWEENCYRIPMSNEIILKGHTKIVSALAIDHSGSRVLSDSLNHLKPEGHQVRNLSWSPTSD